MFTFLQGNFCIYKLDDEENDDNVDDNDHGSKKQAQLKQVGVTDDDSNPQTPELRLLKDLPINRTIEVKVIVYLIRVS